MLLIDHVARTIPKREYFDNESQEFITIDEIHMEEFHLKLEHSLMSISKWESKWHVPFIGRDDLSPEEFRDYIRCMTINQVKNPKVYDWLTQADVNKILDYMQNSYSAWEIRPSKKNGKKKQKLDTVESIYYAMIQFGIPLECEQWHFNRLVALIDYFDSQGGGSAGGGGGQQKKKSNREIMEMYRAMNERNRKRFNSKG